MVKMQANDVNVNEVWKDIDGFVGVYKVNMNGDVVRVCSAQSSFKGRKLNGSIHLGYVRYRLSHKGFTERVFAHVLVAKAFIYNEFCYPFINHKNAVKTDNRVENLEWCTQLQNIHHAYNTNLIPIKKGSEVHSAKLTEASVRQIRAEYNKGVNGYKKLANKYSVDPKNIYSIVNNKTWNHLK